MNNELDEVLELVQLLAQRATGGDYIFRGEPQCYERVSSSLYRRYQDIEADSVDVEVVQSEILQEAKKYTRETDEFEILTQLQHYGGQTNLIDFTTDCFIALFFACDGSSAEDGRVILLNKSGAMSRYITQPRNPANRVIAQKSVFARPPKGFVEPDKIVVTNQSLKRPTLDYLRTNHGISSETIYNDLHGFIRVQDIHKSAYTKFYEGRTFQIKEEYHQAIEQYTQALELDAQLTATYNNRGNSYYHKGDIALAIQDYDQALAIDPRDAAAYSNRGNAYKHKGDLDRAIQDYNRSLGIDPEYADTYYNRGNAFKDKGDLDRAIQDYGKAIEMNKGPSVAYAYYCRGIAWLRLSEWKRARPDLAAARYIGIPLAKALPSVGYEGVADFEHKNDVKLPGDIVDMLTD